ncbi:MAG: signal recognition particle receptor subunit alpha [Nitrososphaeria archaeon]|jgi:signal recognition particle subunit SRP54
MLEELKEGLKNAFDKLLRGGVDEKAIKEFILDLQRTLIKADVNAKVVFEFTKKVEERLRNSSELPGISFKELAIKIVYEEMAQLLGGDYKLQLKPKNVIMLVGIQGSGKTTFSVKLGNYLKQRGYSVGIIEADVYRPGAYEQVSQLAGKVGLNVYGSKDEKDPRKIVENGLKSFSDKSVVIIDTAGRHKNEQELMKEVKELYSEFNPTLTLLVIDATIGQQAYYQAKAFAETVSVGGIVITKLDGTAKGGGALAAAAATGAKVYFISTGERIDEIEEFNPKRFVGRLIGLGDLEGLLERVKNAEIKVSKEQAKKIMSGRFTLEDFLLQIEQMEKLGPMEKIVEMLPLPVKVDKKEIEKAKVQTKRWKAIILSMTPEERINPRVLNSTRIKRIAIGSGTTEKDVKDLLEAFEKGKTFIKGAKRSRFAF